MILSKKIILFSLFLTFTLYAIIPESDFKNILNLAKHSACKDAAENLACGKFNISNLKSKIRNSPFPWRFEITNGYQEGFVYYALLGYANEISENIPLAYDCYQKSLACIDEDKSFDHPLPRAEIYLAIGRTCLAAGRYIDAKSWLDNAFLEAGDNKQLQAAIDRALIQRANEIGDYQEVIFLYQHLASLRSVKVRKCESAKLTKDELANYAQILFYSRKDRDGFSKLLTGISKYGIDNEFNLTTKDKLVLLFLNNITRANDDEIKWFYDLLGWAIVDARAKAGDEHYLAFLCNSRKLMCKVFDYLDPEEDLKKVKKRIDVVKEQVASGNAPWSLIRYPLSEKRNRKNPGIRGALRESSNRKIINGVMEDLPDFEVENLLMMGDCRYSIKNYPEALKMYEKAASFTTGALEYAEYDGTTMKNAAIIGMIQSARHLPKSNYKFPVSNFKFQANSIRAAILSLYLYKTKTNDAGRAGIDTKIAIEELPAANPDTLKFLRWEARRLTHSGKFEDSNRLYDDYEKRSANIDFWTGCRHGCVLLTMNKPEKAFQCFLNTLQHADEVFKRTTVLDVLEKTWSIAMPEDIEKYDLLKKRSAVANAILRNYDMMLLRKLVLANRWMNQKGKNQIELLYANEKNDKEKVIEILTNKFAKSSQFGHQKLLAEFLNSQGETNAAEKVLLKAENSKKEIIKRFLPHCKLTNKTKNLNAN